MTYDVLFNDKKRQMRKPGEGKGYVWTERMRNCHHPFFSINVEK